MSNLVRTMLVPVASLAEVQSALQGFPEATGMFVVPCYTIGTPTLSHYINHGSILSEIVDAISSIEGVDISGDDIHTAITRLNLSFSATMVEE